jgi:hypothetical protein
MSYLASHFHLFNDAALRVGLPLSSFIGPGIPDILEQNDFFLPASALVLGFGAGAFKLEPVAALYLSLPLAVKPAPLDIGNFSPLPTDKTGAFLVAISVLENQVSKQPL